MDLKLCYNTFKFKEGENLTQTFTRYKALLTELVNDGIKLSKLEINTGFINGLPKKWLSFCQSLRNTNHVKESELASLFGKLKYEENLIDNIYETEKKIYLATATPLSTAFFSTSNFQDFQDSLDDEEDIISKEVSSDDNEIVEVKVLMTLVDDNVAVSKEGARNGEWVKISMRKGRTKKHLLSKHKDLVGIKSLHDDLRVTAAQRKLLLLVYVTTASVTQYCCSKIKNVERVSTIKERIRIEDKDCLKNKNTYVTKDMDQDSVHMVAASKVFMLKLGEYELWRMRMEQYIQMIDYSLGEVIENGNAPPITKVVEGVGIIIVPTTAKEKAQRRLELKARSTLLMGILNERSLWINLANMVNIGKVL
ncbi:hypothetical protein Tco_0624402 [Tanacetum coccineum]|uniref:Uncharacterized protein n=1 Tax=Tanacetum coccineum TaxID=301880 RepID=A0ABQ4WE01_9ASTR